MNLRTALLPHALSLTFLCSLGHSGQVSADPAEVAEQVRNWRQVHEQQIVDRFADLLRLPNVASDSVNIRRNAEAITSLLEPRGFDVRLLESAAGPPAVFAERRSKGGE